MNTEKWTDKNGGTDYMVRVPKFRLCEVIDGASDNVHPAFIVGGKEVDAIYISKYQSAVYNGIPYSLPYQKPAVSVTFDEALKLCEDKGEGWHLMSNAERAAIALWCLKNGTLPHGDTAGGKYHADKSERGLTYDGYDALTGSGPATWTHDHTEDGIYDLAGGLWEWTSGLRTLDGKVQIIPDNNAALNVDMSRESKEWQDTGYGFTLREDAETSDDRLTLVGADDIESGWNSTLFAEFNADVEVPELFKALGLFPTTKADAGRVWIDNSGERLPYRGGNWHRAASAGVFALSINSARSNATTTGLGFRAAFVNRADT
jgi:hypothetical protein